MPLKGWNHTWYITNALDYWPGGGGGGRVGVPVLGGKAGGTSEPAGEFSSWNRFLLSMPNWSAPFDWKTILDTEFFPNTHCFTPVHVHKKVFENRSDVQYERKTKTANMEYNPRTEAAWSLLYRSISAHFNTANATDCRPPHFQQDWRY